MLNYWYSFVDTVLPFSWVQYAFMKNALLALLLVAPLFGLLSTMIVSKGMAFFSDSIGHGAFTGIAIGALIGGIKPIWAAILFSVLFAIIITLVKNKSKASTDTIIGVFSSIAIALGLIIISIKGSFNSFSAYFVGDILSITPYELSLLLVVFIVILVLWFLIFNKILLVSINTSLAKSKGINSLLYEMLFTSAIAVVVTITIGWVGLLIINSLLVLPAASARNISNNARQYHIASVSFALFSSVLGLIISYFLNTATGATIVIISAIIFFISLTLKKKIVG